MSNNVPSGRQTDTFGYDGLVSRHLQYNTYTDANCMLYTVPNNGLI